MALKEVPLSSPLYSLAWGGAWGLLGWCLGGAEDPLGELQSIMGSDCRTDPQQLHFLGSFRSQK